MMREIHCVDLGTTSHAKLACSVNSAGIYKCRVRAVYTQDSAVSDDGIWERRLLIMLNTRWLRVACVTCTLHSPRQLGIPR